MQRSGFDGEEEVGSYVASIVRSGSLPYSDGSHMQKTRLRVFRPSAGLAILELRSCEAGEIWSIVTACPGKQPHGTKVGAVG